MCGWVAVLGSRCAQSHINRKHRALARDAGDVDVPSHGLAQCGADGQAQAGAAVLAGGGCVSLAEGFEPAVLSLWWDADARVTNFDVQLQLTVGARGGIDLDVDLPVLGEFNGVSDQVGHNLAQVFAVTVDTVGHLGSDVQAQLQVLFVC